MSEHMTQKMDEQIGSAIQLHEQVCRENKRLTALINAPEVDNFLRGVHIEAVHQVERWGTAHDRAKRPADWFWLVGYLARKALQAALLGNAEKALHCRGGKLLGL